MASIKRHFQTTAAGIGTFIIGLIQTIKGDYVTGVATMTTALGLILSADANKR